VEKGKPESRVAKKSEKKSIGPVNTTYVGLAREPGNNRAREGKDIKGNA